MFVKPRISSGLGLKLPGMTLRESYAITNLKKRAIEDKVSYFFTIHELGAMGIRALPTLFEIANSAQRGSPKEHLDKERLVWEYITKIKAASVWEGLSRYYGPQN